MFIFKLTNTPNAGTQREVLYRATTRVAPTILFYNYFSSSFEFVGAGLVPALSFNFISMLVNINSIHRATTRVALTIFIL